MSGKILAWLLGTLLLTTVSPAGAQQAGKIPRIGYLSAASPSAVATRVEAFRQALRELGYVEGKNVLIESRYAEGKVDRLADMAAELVRLNIDVIVTAAPSSTRAAKKVTSTIPIVMSGVGGDPVEAGFVASLARPGGNVTGLTALSQELIGKQLELVKEIVPRLSRVAVLGTSTIPGYAQVKDMELAARAFNLQLQHLDVLIPKDLDTAFQQARNGRAEAALVRPSPVLESQRREIAERAVKSRLPMIYPFAEFAEVGGLMVYGVNISDLHRRSAIYVDKILKGVKPAELPVEQPTKFELVINLKAAKQIGLTIPPNVLARADRVIK
jgi:putative tryptophan/tyrosine transport system substrate-binding protein